MVDGKHKEKMIERGAYLAFQQIEYFALEITQDRASHLTTIAERAFQRWKSWPAVVQKKTAPFAKIVPNAWIFPFLMKIVLRRAMIVPSEIAQIFRLLMMK